MHSALFIVVHCLVAYLSREFSSLFVDFGCFFVVCQDSRNPSQGVGRIRGPPRK